MLNFTLAVALTAMIVLTTTTAVADYQQPLIFGGRAADGILGADDRAPLARTSVTGKKIVRLLDASERFLCTGTVIGPSLVLTAAHCLQINDRWPKGNEAISFVETWDGKLSRIQSRRVLRKWRGWSNDGAIDSSEFAFDIGLIWTVDEVAKKTGIMRVIPPLSEIPQATAVTLVAYHGDILRRRGSRLVSEECLAQFGTYLITLDVWRVPHRCDAAPGSSGGPLLIDYGNGEKAVAAIAVAEGYSWWHPIASQNTAVRVDRQGKGGRFVRKWIEHNFAAHGQRQPERRRSPAWL